MFFHNGCALQALIALTEFSLFVIYTSTSYETSVLRIIICLYSDLSVEPDDVNKSELF